MILLPSVLLRVVTIVTLEYLKKFLPFFYFKNLKILDTYLDDCWIYTLAYS